MKKILMAAAFALVGALFALAGPASAAVVAPAQGASIDQGSMAIDVRDESRWRRGDDWRYHRRGYRPDNYVRWHDNHLKYRNWSRRNYYGTIIGGIALGTLLAGSSYYAYAHAPPGPGLCWYWADRYEREGYWDYC
jgi:hypothetical protein